jgi:hypothetical protein
MPTRIAALLTAAFAFAPMAAHAGLPACADRWVAELARDQFNGSMELRGSSTPRRARSFEDATETGRMPYVHPLAPPEYELRFCEGALRLDDTSTLRVFISVVGKERDGKHGAEALETCWEDPRFPRAAPGCDGEKAPARR